jgi:hypothetical protein
MEYEIWGTYIAQSDPDYWDEANHLEDCPDIDEARKYVKQWRDNGYCAFILDKETQKNIT